MKNSILLLLLIATTTIFSQETPKESQDDFLIDYSEVQVKPEFPGGMKSFYSFIAKNFITPEEENLKGKIIVDCIIEKDGTLSNMKVREDVGYGSGEEAIRVLNKLPKWRPGQQNGYTVRTSYFVKIHVESTR